MLVAILYMEENRIAAAAPACDQVPYGEQYWNEIHAGDISFGKFFETAYREILDARLRDRLFAVGIDSEVCGQELATEVNSLSEPGYLTGRAA